MTTQLDLRDAATPANRPTEPPRRSRWRTWWLPIGLAAGAVTTVGAVLAARDDTTVERVPMTPATGVDARPAVEPTNVGAGSVRVGDQFDGTPIDRGAARTASESPIIRAERAWAGSEFDRVPTTDVCLIQIPC
jgi:hypothetical protein